MNSRYKLNCRNKLAHVQSAFGIRVGNKIALTKNSLEISAFSLIEVILALGILSVALLIVFGILTPFIDRTGEVVESSNVNRITDRISAEIEQLSFQELINVLNQETGLFASREGDRLLLATDPELDTQLPEAERHYSITVSIVLLGLLLAVSTNILDAWGSSRDSLSTNAKARIILDTLSSDLESAILKNDQGVWLACDLLESTTNSGNWESAASQKPTGTASLQIDLEDPDLTANDYRFGVAGSWIRFFASPVDASESGDGGDVNAIAYQLIRRKPHSRSSELDVGYNLYRSVVRGDHTLEEVIEDEGYFIDAFDGASYEGQPGEIVAPRNDSSLLARNIVDFGIAFYENDDSGKLRPVYPLPSSSRSFRIPTDGTPTSTEIFVRILEEEGAKRLNAYERGLIPTEDPDFWWNTVNQFSTVYTQRVQFKGGAP